MGQRAKISRINYGAADSAMRPGCCGHPVDALAEARAILADAEPDARSADGLPECTYHAAVYLSAATLTHGTMLSEAQAALIDRLSAFVEA
jgi:hypothetical protein